MRRYIVIWLVVILLVDMAAYGIMVSTGGSFIKSNVEYKKIYPCVDAYLETYYDEKTGEHSIGPSKEYYDAEPSIHESQKHSVYIYYTEIIVILDILLAGVAVFLYIIFTNRNDRADVSLGCSFLFVLFLVGFGFFGFYYLHTITTPGEIIEVHYAAPIIYLYDEQEREATVKLDLNGELTCTYPKYNEETGWVVKTSADGVLTDANGRRYEYLYWEADLNTVPDFSNGFCVRGEDSAAFLEKALSDLGLTDTEANAFIMYWLPQLEENPYNIVTFQTETYENAAKLNVDPVPDTVVRVNMLFYGTDEYVEIEAQDLTSMNPAISERVGFVLVEWGGAKLSEK